MRPRDAVLSIQSAVAYGHVGNSAAVLPLQRLGFDVFPVPTVLLAHHPGQGRGWRGHKVEPERIEEILDGLAARGAFARCAAVLSGYLGDAAVGGLVLEALAAVRAARPDALYLCDPVIGDDASGVFVSAGIPEVMRERLLPAADILTPNRFELARLSGRPVENLTDAQAAAAALRARGPAHRRRDRARHAGPAGPTGRAGGHGGRELAGDHAAPAGRARRYGGRVQRPIPWPLSGGRGQAARALWSGRSGAMFALVERTHAAGADELAAGRRAGRVRSPLEAISRRAAAPAGRNNKDLVRRDCPRDTVLVRGVE